MIKNIWIKYKEYILVLIYIAILFALFCFIIRPLVQRIDYNANLIQEKITTHENFKKKLKMLSTNEEQIQAIEKDESKMKVFISKDQEITLIEKIEKIAEETGNGISIEAVDDKNTISKAKISSSKAKEESKDNLKINTDNNDFVKFRITISGKYTNSVNFIRKIENMEYWSDIISLVVSYKEPSKTPATEETLIGSIEMNEAEEKIDLMEKGTASSVIEIIFYLNVKI